MGRDGLACERCWRVERGCFAHLRGNRGDVLPQALEIRVHGGHALLQVVKLVGKALELAVNLAQEANDDAERRADVLHVL